MDINAEPSLPDWKYFICKSTRMQCL